MRYVRSRLLACCANSSISILLFGTMHLGASLYGKNLDIIFECYAKVLMLDKLDLVALYGFQVA